MPDSRPNIIFIITDQQRFDTIRELGFEHMDTPHLDRLAAGLVLTGGTSQLRGIDELAEQRLDLPARVGGPRGCTGLTDLITTPAYTTVVGLAKHALRGAVTAQRPAGARKDDPESGFLKRVAAFGRAFIPQ